MVLPLVKIDKILDFLEIILGGPSTGSGTLGTSGSGTTFRRAQNLWDAEPVEAPDAVRDTLSALP